MLREAVFAARNLLIGANLKTVFKPPRQAVHYAGECLFLDRAMNPNGDLPQRHIWEVFGVDYDIPVRLIPGAADEWFRAVASYGVDLIALCTLCAIVKPTVIFEIGTLRGAGAAHLAANSDALVYTLDLPSNTAPHLKTTVIDREHIELHAERFLGYSERIQALYGDSALFDFSRFYGQVDLFFIDGSHSYEYVKNDTMQALACVRSGGVLCWHDYGRCGVNGVSKWLHELRAQGRNIFRAPGGSLAYMRIG